MLTCELMELVEACAFNRIIVEWEKKPKGGGK